MGSDRHVRLTPVQIRSTAKLTSCRASSTVRPSSLCVHLWCGYHEFLDDADDPLQDSRFAVRGIPTVLTSSKVVDIVQLTLSRGTGLAGISVLSGRVRTFIPRHPLRPARFLHRTLVRSQPPSVQAALDVARSWSRPRRPRKRFRLGCARSTRRTNNSTIGSTAPWLTSI